MRHHKEKPQALISTSENSFDVVSQLDETDNESENSLADGQGRHDGWTGERMAMFCALLAETGIVTQACHGVGKSTTSAYSARRRSPLFAAAWEEALNLARNRLADALLERSLTGCVEKYYRDGELVGEKRILDNRLAIQVLKRLDARAQALGLAQTPVRPERSGAEGERSRSADVTPDWDLMLCALRTGDEAMIAEALVEAGKVEGRQVGEVGEVCVPGNSDGDTNFDPEEPDPRCWWDEDDECWMTDFPPPAGFSGYEKGRWGDEGYRRECTADESRLLAAAADAELAEERSGDEALREEWFARLKAIAEPRPEPKRKPKRARKKSQADAPAK